MEKFYVVYVGRNPGIYRKWSECKAETFKVPNAVYCSFNSLAKASALFGEFREEEEWLKGKTIPCCQSCGKKLFLKVSNARENIGKHYYTCGGCGGLTYVKRGVKECSDGADGSSSSAIHTVVSALIERCKSLEEEVRNISRETDLSQERAAILEEALHNLTLDDD